MSNGKGSKRRPAFVSDEAEQAAWERTFKTSDPAVLNAVLSPPEPNAALVRAAASHRAMLDGDDAKHPEWKCRYCGHEHGDEMCPTCWAMQRVCRVSVPNGAGA